MQVDNDFIFLARIRVMHIRRDSRWKNRGIKMVPVQTNWVICRSKIAHNEYMERIRYCRQGYFVDKGVEVADSNTRNFIQLCETGGNRFIIGDNQVIVFRLILDYVMDKLGNIQYFGSFRYVYSSVFNDVGQPFEVFVVLKVVGNPVVFKGRSAQNYVYRVSLSDKFFHHCPAANNVTVAGSLNSV